MKTTNDELIKSFLLSQKREIPDNGFSRKVMDSIPDNKYNWGRWITLSCWILGIALFVLLGGVNVIVGTFCDILTSQSTQHLLMTSIPKLVLGMLIFTGTVVYHLVNEER